MALGSKERCRIHRRTSALLGILLANLIAMVAASQSSEHPSHPTVRTLKASSIPKTVVGAGANLTRGVLNVTNAATNAAFDVADVVLAVTGNCSGTNSAANSNANITKRSNCTKSSNVTLDSRTEQAAKSLGILSELRTFLRGAKLATLIAVRMLPIGEAIFRASVKVQGSASSGQTVTFIYDAKVNGGKVSSGAPSPPPPKKSPPPPKRPPPTPKPPPVGSSRGGNASGGGGSGGSGGSSNSSGTGSAGNSTGSSKRIVSPPGVGSGANSSVVGAGNNGTASNGTSSGGSPGLGGDVSGNSTSPDAGTPPTDNSTASYSNGNGTATSDNSTATPGRLLAAETAGLWSRDAASGDDGSLDFDFGDSADAADDSADDDDVSILGALRRQVRRLIAAKGSAFPTHTPACNTGPYVAAVVIPLPASCKNPPRGKFVELVRQGAKRFLRLSYGAPGAGCQRRYNFQYPNFHGKVVKGAVIMRVCKAGPPRMQTCQRVTVTTAVPQCR
eukprot:TRINITY_DN15278_c0_g1_i1.p1 TRINITY_DN15278_c0_g1~~TRINITY_DN15278_c0_g1_i1.p1  ORF type:complete len:503 (-),score=-33.26 TRINITY_DN15278_c0_g1_i1:494-2002(-)